MCISISGSPLVHGSPSSTMREKVIYRPGVPYELPPPPPHSPQSITLLISSPRLPLADEHATGFSSHRTIVPIDLPPRSLMLPDFFGSNGSLKRVSTGTSASVGSDGGEASVRATCLPFR